METLGALFGFAFGWLALVAGLFGAALGIAATVLWVWMLVDVLTKETDENNNRLIWTLVIVFTQWIGALIYLFVRRQERVRKLGK